MVKMHFEGGRELEQALSQLSLRVGAKVLREALETGGELIRARASQLAPHAPGAPDLAQNIGISPMRLEGAMASIKIGPTKGFAYGLPQELGTRHHAAHPFMRPAFDTQAPKSLAVISQELWRQLAGRGIGRTATALGPVQSLGSLR